MSQKKRMGSKQGKRGERRGIGLEGKEGEEREIQGGCETRKGEESNRREESNICSCKVRNSISYTYGRHHLGLWGSAAAVRSVWWEVVGWSLGHSPPHSRQGEELCS